jgi:D-alanyl-D-alanine carboxypeptidase/D-alanyl-D-alanine-endopeptidase (penicillin-binding protein 4)
MSTPPSAAGRIAKFAIAATLSPHPPRPLEGAMQPSSSPCSAATQKATRRSYAARPLLALLAAIFLAAPAAAQDRAELTRRRVAGILSGLKAATQVGVFVADARTGAIWFESDADEPLKPASVLKLFTTAAAIIRLGPEFQYETRVYRNGSELWVIGAGDPGLDDDRINRKYDRPPDFLLRTSSDALSKAGGPPITKLVLDDSVFDDELRHPSWPADQYMAWYQAPVGGISYNDNCLDSRAALQGGDVVLTLLPPLPPEFVHNTMRPGKTHRPIVRREANSDIFEFSGTLAHGGALEPVSANRPTVFFGHALRVALQKAGLGREIGVVARDFQPRDLAALQPALVHRTALRDVVWRANTFSQNMFAECLLKSLEAYGPDGRRSGVSGSWAGGVQVLRSTLSGVGVDLRTAKIVDGCGLSHEDRVTARQIVSLLLAMSHQPSGAVYRESLADAGQEGTLKNRYKDPAFAGRLNAKTGTIQNVHALAGYLDRPDGTPLVFAILVNGPAGAELPARIARALVD